MPILLKERPKNRKKAKRDPLNPDYYLIFTHYVGAVKPWYNWDEKAIKKTEQRVKALLKAGI
jgi:hypothetical protein